jgi:pimeloyl-ACP methyl ester carboxylesterase
VRQKEQLKALRAQVDVLGYSFGAGAGLRLAVQHPELVRRLALVSGGFAQDGFYPEMLPMQAQVGAAMAEQMKGTPMYQSYVAVAPNPDDFPKLLDRMGELMRTPYNWSEDVKTLKMPVMLVYGDSDMYRPDASSVLPTAWQRTEGCRLDARKQSPNRLAILPDLTHYEMSFAPELARTVFRSLMESVRRAGPNKWAQ